MAELEFQVRFVSPAFVGGATSGVPKRIVFLKGTQQHGYHQEQVDVEYTPVDSCGLRIPSLRGVLEFWFRTLLPSTQASEILELQGESFGSTAFGQRLSIRMLGRPDFQAKELRFESQAFPMVYLGYGPLQLLRIPRGSTPAGLQVATSYNHLRCRDAIDVGGELPRFGFQARGSSEALNSLKRALSLLHLFGGIGGRSRRGWGSSLVEADFLQEPPTSFADFQTWFKELLGGLWDEGSEPSQNASRPRHSAFWQGARVFLTEPQGDGYQAVLKDFYDRFAEVRLWRPPASYSRSPIAQADHDGEEIDAKTPRGAVQILRVPERIAFGLPYQPRSKRDWEISYRGMSPGGKSDVTRRASPLILKVFRLQDGRHVGVVLFLPSEFFGVAGTSVTATTLNGSATNSAPFPGYGAIEALFDFKTFPRQSKRSAWTQISLP